jgi:cell division initiation protein
MRITPLDVRKQEFRKVVRGLDAEEVYAFLATVADEYETVLTDNKQLRERVLELDEKVSEYRNMEKTLRDTLLTAERVMAEARENARKEGELIVRDARVRVDHEIAAIANQVQVLKAQVRELRNQRDGFLARLRGLAEGQLGLVDSYARDFRDDDDQEHPNQLAAQHAAQNAQYAGQQPAQYAGQQPAPPQTATGAGAPRGGTPYGTPASAPAYGPPPYTPAPPPYGPAGPTQSSYGPTAPSPAGPIPMAPTGPGGPNVGPAAPPAYGGERGEPDRWRDYDPNRDPNRDPGRASARDTGRDQGRDPGRDSSRDSGRAQRVGYADPRSAAYPGTVGVPAAAQPMAGRAAAGVAAGGPARASRGPVRGELEFPAAVPPPPVGPVETRVDALPESRLFFDEQAEQVADAVVSVAADMAQAAQVGYEAEHEGDDPWSILSPAGQPRESVAPYPADPQAAPAPQPESSPADDSGRRSGAGWSRWAIDKFSKALGDF